MRVRLCKQTFYILVQRNWNVSILHISIGNSIGKFSFEASLFLFLLQRSRVHLVVLLKGQGLLMETLSHHAESNVSSLSKCVWKGFIINDSRYEYVTYLKRATCPAMWELQRQVQRSTNREDKVCYCSVELRQVAHQNHCCWYICSQDMQVSLGSANLANFPLLDTKKLKC